MSEHLLDAADEISSIQVGTGYESVTIGITAALEAARALDAAGLLVTPERDAAVAAKALREVVEIFDGDCIDLADELRWTTDAPKGWSEGSVAFAIEATLLFGPWLTARANRIEREAGESDADA